MDAAYARLTFNSDLAQAVANADLVIEAIPEVVSIKTEFYTNLGKVAPAKTILQQTRLLYYQANLLKQLAVLINFSSSLC